MKVFIFWINFSKFCLKMARFAISVLLIFLLAGKKQCRSLKSEKTELVSDGVDGELGFRPQILDLNGGELFEDTCQHVYGFLPCADNIRGYIFQVVVFECLLLAGDYLLSEASIQLFDVFGVGFFGAIVFRLLIMLPRIALILASALSASHEDAQTMVVTSVGLTAGYTVFCLTLQWGSCIIFARTDISHKHSNPPDSSNKSSFYKNLLTIFTDSGVNVDDKTKRGAGVMLLSLIPFLMVQLSEIFELPSSKRDVILITLMVSISAVVLYFAYQFLDPSDQKRSLEYLRIEHLLAHFLRLVAKDAKNKIEDSKDLSGANLERLVLGIGSGKLQVDNAYALAEFLKVFDSDADGSVSKDEFMDGCERLIKQARTIAEHGESSSRASSMEIEKVVEKWIEHRRSELEQIPELMSLVFNHVPNLLHQSLLGDANPDRQNIERLFNQLDSDSDGKIQTDKLENVTMEFEFENVKNISQDLGEYEDSRMEKKDYFKGITNLINEVSQLNAESNSFESADEHTKVIWENAAGVMSNKKFLSRDTMKAMVKIIIGAVIVIFLGRPLMTNIQLLSESVGIPPFIISFVVIPLAINVRQALAARFPARQKIERTASLTFSQIYAGVVMNNILSLSIILSIVYARGLMWDYSTEVLVVSMVGFVVGLLAFTRSTYPFWTCIVAFSLYPLSLFLVCALQYFSDWD